MKAAVLVLAGLSLATLMALGQGGIANVERNQALVGEYCAGCHNDLELAGGFSWTSIDLAHPERSPETVEKVIRKVRAGMMPPAGAPRPDHAELQALAAGLEDRLDRASAAEPHVSAPDLHRLNRTEYRNVIRDLLDLEIDVDELLPADPKAGSFDNMADALTVTPALMQGYIRAAERISRLAVGDPNTDATTVGYKDLDKIGRAANQYRRADGAPFGTRGGLSVVHNFPADGEYVFRAALFVYPTGVVVGARLPEPLENQELGVFIDGEQVASFMIDATMQEFELDEALISEPIPVTAGPHQVSVVFVSKFDGPVEDQYWLIEQTLADYSVANKPGMTGLPHLRNFFITGPMSVSGISETPSRRKIFSCLPVDVSDEERCATEIVSRLARQAFRRPVSPEDLEALMTHYAIGREDGDFEAGVQAALQAILVRPEFVFRFERIPGDIGPGQTFRISDLELASRLSFFLWSSAPDENLLALASQGRLRDAGVLEGEIRRMLADPRSEALAKNFAGQWLRLGGLHDVLPEAMHYPQFTRNLAVSMRREIELLFDSIVREDRNVLDLMTADYTWVDEVLAEHYGIPDVLGNRFQRVTLTDPTRFGLLGKAGILTLTALANRTSPVARGKYVLEVLIGSPPPNPPPTVPPLAEARDNEKTLSVRERIEQHRDNPACSACHQIMDPIGLAMENFDPTGQWRINDSGFPIDASGRMYDGMTLDGPESVRRAVLKYSDAFLANFAGQLTSYGLGRMLDHRDMPTVRSVAREAAAEGHRFSAFVMEIVRSPLFQMSINNNETQQ